MYYPQDHLTDHPERFVMAEFPVKNSLFFKEEVEKYCCNCDRKNAGR